MIELSETFFVTQMRLAQIQQYQSDIADLTSRLKKEWAAVRKEILKGAPVQRGPIHVIIRESGKRKTMVIK